MDDYPKTLPGGITRGPNRAYNYRNPNYKATVNNPQFINALFSKLQLLKQRTLRNEERSFIITKIRNLDPKILQDNPVETVIASLASILDKSLNNLPQGSIRENLDVIEKIDMHELMRQTIGTTSEQGPDYPFKGFAPGSGDVPGYESFGSSSDISNFLGCTTTSQLCREINPKTIEGKNYIMLDSRYRLGTYGPITNFMWDFIPNLTLTEGSVNIYGILRDLISVRIYPIRLPYTVAADNEQKRITMNVAEFLPQGYVAHENRRFQFIFSTIVDSQWIDCDTQNYNDGYYSFQKPLTRLDRMTISFGNPLTPIQFDPDRSNYTVTYGLVTLITTAQNHNCQTGDKVYFSDFTTIAPIVDSVTINQINNPEGLFMTFIALNQFTIPIDTTGIAIPPPGVNMTVYFGAKRILVPMELTYLTPL